MRRVRRLCASSTAVGAEQYALFACSTSGGDGGSGGGGGGGGEGGTGEEAAVRVSAGRSGRASPRPLWSGEERERHRTGENNRIVPGNRASAESGSD